jgi:hypothetical protein
MASSLASDAHRPHGDEDEQEEHGEPDQAATRRPWRRRRPAAQGRDAGGAELRDEG